MKAVSLFAGIGGFDLGLERASIEIVGQVERDPFAQRVLAARWSHVTCWPDVREWPGDWHEPLDLLCGGFPCQDLSVAGKRKGLAGERSGLFGEIVRIAKALQPTWGLFENVPGLFSSGGGRDMATVLEGLRECWPVVGYAVLDSQYFGVPQRRRRVFFICGPTERRVEQVLFESEGGIGDLASGGEAGPDLAASLRSRSHRPGVNPPGRGGEDDMNLILADALTTRHFSDRGDGSDNSKLVVAATLNCSSQQGGFRSEPGEHLTITHTLRAEHDGSEDGTGRGTPITPIAQGVRRLTPTECERLQGFPDGWTCLCQPLESYDSMKCKCPDGPRYKTLGNAVSVPKVKWIGRRILEASR